MQAGSAELTRATAAYAVCLAFALTFLLSVLYGTSIMTGVIRGVIVAILTSFVAPLLLRPAFGAILDAMARDRAQRAPAEDDSE